MRLSWKRPGDIDAAVAEARAFGASTPAREALLRAALILCDRAEHRAAERRAGLPPTGLRITPERLADVFKPPVFTEGSDAEAETRYILAVCSLALTVDDAVSAG